jgi:hypothetical protein
MYDVIILNPQMEAKEGFSVCFEMIPLGTTKARDDNKF